jgi:hypothetical protein
MSDKTREEFDKIVKYFISCFAKDHEELYLVSFNEKQCLEDATDHMKAQQKKIDELEAELHTIRAMINEKG